MKYKKCQTWASCDGSNFYSSLEKEEMNGGHSLSYNQNPIPMPADIIHQKMACSAEESSFLRADKEHVREAGT